MLALSSTGEHGRVWYTLCAAGALLDPGRRSSYVRSAGVVLGAFAVNQSVKLVIRRTRPRLEGLPPLTPT